MRKLYRLLCVMAVWLMAYSQVLLAQSPPIISAEDDPVWFEIESACTNPITLNGAYTGPSDLRGYVLYDPMAGDGRIYARLRQGGDEELWALIQNGSIVRLKNKGTGRYMTASHSLNTTGENVVYGSLGDNQYWLRSGATNQMVIWNDLRCDRLNTYEKDSNTAFHFILKSDLKSILGSLIQSAEMVLNDMVAIDPGFVAPDSPAVDDLTSAIETAKNVYDSTDESPNYDSAINFLNDAIDTFKASPKNEIVISDETLETWYYIVSAAIQDYSRGKVIVNRSMEPGVRLQFDDKKVDPNMLWKVIAAGDGKYAIQNRASGLYIAVPVTEGTAVVPGGYNILGLGDKGQFSIYADGANPLHCQNNGSLIVSWPGGLDTPSAWRFETVSGDIADTPMAITGVSVANGQVTTGMGNKDYAALYFDVQVEGFTGELHLDNVNVDFNGTSNLSDISNARVFSIGTDRRFKGDNGVELGNAQILNEVVDIALVQPYALLPGNQRFALVVDVAEEAVEGNRIDASVNLLRTLELEDFMPASPSPAHPATIFMNQYTLFSPGDRGSLYYRIPAIVTANDGSLVTAVDKRNNHEGDLPADIDLYVRRSTDNGKTWDEPVMIAGEGSAVGYGDPALVVERETGKIFCILAHDRGFFQSTADNPIRVVVCESSDNGITWSAPVDITNSLYGAGSTNEVSKYWNGLFLASGRGLQLHNGRLMFAAAVRGTGSGIDNYVIYSDDQGQTWNMNTNMVHQGGDEAKLAQRNNGDVIISIRNWGKREWNISSDNGWTWGVSTIHDDLVDPNCNGEMMVYTSTLDGYDKNRMLHSLAYASNRSNVSMLLSYDEGQTFPIVKTICPAASAYSTFTILPDGTIGMYYEDGSIGGGYDMVYVRFSLDWLTDGQDTYSAPVSNSISSPLPDDTRIWVQDRKIFVDCPIGCVYQVYNMSGVQMDARSPLHAGVYLVKFGAYSEKVVVK